jgi:hypothetical protein
MTETRHSTDSRTFVLRLWSEQEEGRRAWRFSLEDPLTRGRRAFASLGEVGDFLASLCRDNGQERSGERSDSPPPLRRKAAALVLSLLLPFGTALAEPPRISLGEVQGAPGAAVAVPVVLRAADAQPIGALSLRIRVEPASAAESIAFRRAGAWAEKRTAFEARPQAGGSFSWLVSLSEPAAVGTDTLVGEIVVRLARGLRHGTEVGVLLDPAVSGFGDRAGTRFVSAETGGLLLEDGSITVPERVRRDERR